MVDTGLTIEMISTYLKDTQVLSIEDDGRAITRGLAPGRVTKKLC